MRPSASGPHASELRPHQRIAHTSQNRDGVADEGVRAVGRDGGETIRDRDEGPGPEHIHRVQSDRVEDRHFCVVRAVLERGGFFLLDLCSGFGRVRNDRNFDCNGMIGPLGLPNHGEKKNVSLVR